MARVDPDQQLGETRPKWFFFGYQDKLVLPMTSTIQQYRSTLVLTF